MVRLGLIVPLALGVPPTTSGQISFTDVTVEAGPITVAPTIMGAAWFDMEPDGDVDLYLLNTGSIDRLFRNEGDGTFTEVAGVVGALPVTSAGGERRDGC